MTHGAVKDLPEQVKAAVGVMTEDQNANLRATMKQLEGDQQPGVRSQTSIINEIITEDLVKQFERDGAVLLKSAFSQKWIDKVKNGIAKNLKKPSEYSENLKVLNLTFYYFKNTFFYI